MTIGTQVLVPMKTTFIGIMTHLNIRSFCGINNCPANNRTRGCLIHASTDHGQLKTHVSQRQPVSLLPVPIIDDSITIFEDNNSIGVFLLLDEILIPCQIIVFGVKIGHIFKFGTSRTSRQTARIILNRSVLLIKGDFPLSFLGPCSRSRGTTFIGDFSRIPFPLIDILERRWIGVVGIRAIMNIGNPGRTVISIVDIPQIGPLPRSLGRRAGFNSAN